MWVDVLSAALYAGRRGCFFLVFMVGVWYDTALPSDHIDANCCIISGIDKCQAGGGGGSEDNSGCLFVCLFRLFVCLFVCFNCRLVFASMLTVLPLPYCRLPAALF